MRPLLGYALGYNYVAVMRSPRAGRRHASVGLGLGRRHLLEDVRNLLLRRAALRSLGAHHLFEAFAFPSVVVRSAAGDGVVAKLSVRHKVGELEIGRADSAILAVERDAATDDDATAGRQLVESRAATGVEVAVDCIEIVAAITRATGEAGLPGGSQRRLDRGRELRGEITVCSLARRR